MWIIDILKTYIYGFYFFKLPTMRALDTALQFYEKYYFFYFLVIF